jgi:hypothetical protein
MGTVTTFAPLRPLAPARSARRGPGSCRVAAWYAVFAVYAGGVALFSGPGEDRWWGIWAVGGYAAAAGLAAGWRSRRGRQAALAVSLAGALAAPLTWLATRAPATPDVTVVARSGALLLHHATPYLPPAQLAHGGWLAYDPYLPVMAVFGLPRALGLPGLLGDPRPWLAAATFLLLAAAFRAVAPAVTARGVPGLAASVVPAPAPAPTPAPAPAAPDHGALAASLRLAAFATASPLVAFPLALGITDPPVLALICLALALLTRPARAAAHSRSAAIRARSAPPARAWPVAPVPAAARAWLAALGRPAGLAAVVLGIACAMKYTAWPALVVLTAMVAVRDGVRAAGRFAVIAAGTATALAAVFAPASLTAPAALFANTILFPLGLTKARSPAQSPLPGHLLATLGPAGHLAAIILLITAGVAIALSLVIRPPADTPAAARRLALGLALMFALSPATRFGYFAYPLGLLGWIALAHRVAASRNDLGPRRTQGPQMINTVV